MKITPTHEWDSKELEEVLSKLYGPDYLQMNKKYIDSFWKKVFAAWLNRDEANRIINDLIPVNDNSFFDNEYINALDYHFTCFGDKDKKADLDYKKQHIETHILAYAMNLYSLSDIMAQILVTSYHIRDKFGPDDIYLGSVCSFLSQGYDCRNILRKINKLFNLDSFKYLKCFVNVQKHIYHIDVPYSFISICKSNEVSHGMKIERFDKGEKHFGEKWAKEFLVDDFVEIFDAYLQIGCEINKTLSPRTAFLI